MKKLFKISLLSFLSLALFTGLLFGRVKADEPTSSEYVRTVNELQTTPILGGVTLYEQKMSSLLNGDPGKRFQEHFVQWVDLESNDLGVQLVSWTKQTADSWSAGTTKVLARDWEKNHPGWMVIAGTNADFFNNSGTCTWEPTNNFMGDGDMYRADLVGGYRGVVGIKEDNSRIVGDPTFSSKMQLYVYDENGELSTKLPIESYNQAPTTGITLLTKDATKEFDLTGYTVYVGKYTICRVSNGTKKTVFVKGSIESSREGTTSELAREKREIDGSVTTTREFYLVTKDASFATTLANGTKVKCQFDYTGDWADVVNSTGFVHQMLSNGVSLNQKSTDSFIYTDHPRTFIGFKENGTPVMMVVDGRGKTEAEKNYGVSLFEGAEIMKLAGCVDAYNLDGGGSSTLIVRDGNDFRVINRPSDGSERSTGNALFLVMRDSGLIANKQNATNHSITLTKDTVIEGATNYKIIFNGNRYEMTGDSITIDGLEENTEYEFLVEFDLNGKTEKSFLKGTTKSYDLGVDIEENSHGFTFNFRKTSDTLRTSKVIVSIDGNEHVIDNANGENKKFSVMDLYLDELYTLDITYEITNLEKGTKYTRTETVELRTLNYEVPQIVSLSAEVKRGKLKIEFEIKDLGKVVDSINLILNGEKIELDTSDTSYSVDFDENKKYTYQLEVIYSSGEKQFTITSEELSYGDDIEQPEPVEPVQPVTPEPAPTPKKKGCKKNSALVLITLVVGLSTSLYFIRKRK